MDNIFMNSENSKTSDHHRLLHNLSDKITFKGNDKQIALSKRSIYCIWKNIQKSYNTFKVSALTWNEELELPNK